MCGCGGKNQTHKSVHNFLSKIPNRKEQEEVPGTGLFLVPAPDIGILEHKTVYVERITYTETMKRGENCVAYQFIPLAMSGLDEIKTAMLGCNGTFCEGNSDCRDPCWCLRNRCVG